MVPIRPAMTPLPRRRRAVRCPDGDGCKATEGLLGIVTVRRATDEEVHIMRRTGHSQERPVHGGRVVEAERYPPASLLPGTPDQLVGRGYA